MSVAPVIFGVVHRGVGVEHQLALIFAVAGVDRNADAQRHHQLIARDGKRALNGFDQRIRHRGGVVGIVNFNQ